MNNMTEGNIKKTMLKFAIPLFISQLFQQLYNTADSIIVGKLLGTDALASVSASGSLIFLIICFFDGAAMGAGVLISKCFGSKDNDGISRAVHTNILLCFCSGIMISIFGGLMTPTLLRWVNVDQEIIADAISYLRTFLLGGVTLTMYNACRSIMMSVGDSKRPLYYLIFSSVLNVLLDLLFIGVLHYGVWSAALATIISQGVSAILCLVKLMKEDSLIKVEFKKIRFHKKELLLIVKYGLPSGIQNSVIGLANVIVQSQINTFFKIATATYGIYSKIEGFIFLPIISFNMAITTFVSQNLGAKKYDRAKKGARFGMFLAVTLAASLGVIYMVFVKGLYGLFTDDIEVILLGKIQVFIIAPFYFLLALSHSIAAVFRGAGRAVVPMGVMLVCWCLIRICYIFFVMHQFGEITYIYWAYPFTWALSTTLYLIFYFKSDWIHGFEK